MASVLASKREFCRICLKPLIMDSKRHVVVIYHEQRGTYLGSRVTKFCNNCKVHEHYGYWTVNGERQFEENCLEYEFLLSSEETALDLSLIRQCANLLIVGAVPFSTYARSYNRKFGYIGECEDADADDLSVVKNKTPVKRMKR